MIAVVAAAGVVVLEGEVADSWQRWTSWVV